MAFDYKKYKEYLQSVEWANIKLDLYANRGRKCERCRSTKFIQVHHISYDNLYNEEPEDLEILCGTCHKKVHGIGEKKKKPGLSTWEIKHQNYLNRIKREEKPNKKSKKRKKSKPSKFQRVWTNSAGLTKMDIEKRKVRFALLKEKEDKERLERLIKYKNNKK